MKEMLNERLAKLLQGKNITQKELASKAGVTEAAVSHYLKGDRVPRASVLARIAQALGTTVDYLVSGNEEEQENEIQYAQRLIARNVYQMSKEEKMEIIRILMADN